MPGLTHKLEKILADLFGFDHVVMLGRARSGLVALLAVLQQGTNRSMPVLLPENICPVLVAAIKAGGGQAVTVPVSPETGLPDDQAFVHAMKQSRTKGIVMPAHLYGFQGDYPETIKYARREGWFILENDTNAIRMQSKDIAFGDALLVSFGYAKPIEVGGGGAILTNDATLAQALQNCVSYYDLLEENTQVQEKQVMLDRRELRGKTNETPAQFQANLSRICGRETALSKFRFDIKDIEILIVKLHEFPEEKKKRLERRANWDAALAPLDHILCPVSMGQPVPWRVIRRVMVNRPHFLQALWQHKIDAGINYRSLWREFPDNYLSGEASSPDLWGDTVLNLWVTEDYTKTKIEQASGLLMEVADAI